MKKTRPALSIVPPSIMLLSIVLGSGLAAAQTTDQPAGQPENCQAQPDGNTTQNKDVQQQKPRSDNLSGSLQPCGGVLKPPPTGDRNATAPPSTGSDMPVIKPGQVPPQTSR